MSIASDKHLSLLIGPGVRRCRYEQDRRVNRFNRSEYDVFGFVPSSDRDLAASYAA
jgi:hypothetical protein